MKLLFDFGQWIIPHYSLHIRHEEQLHFDLMRAKLGQTIKSGDWIYDIDEYGIVNTKTKYEILKIEHIRIWWKDNTEHTVYIKIPPDNLGRVYMEDVGIYWTKVRFVYQKKVSRL